jgi:transcriptional regulator GlxA family with amidase domain
LKYDNPDFTWLRVAVETGYHDYQHLSKDFLEFSSVLPNELIQQETSSPDSYFGFKE